MWTHWLQGKKQVGSRLERLGCCGVPTFWTQLPPPQRTERLGQPREADVTGPTDWWSNSEPRDWGTWRVVQAPGEDAYTAPPSLGVRASHFLQSEVGEPGDLGVQCASLAHPVGTAER